MSTQSPFWLEYSGRQAPQTVSKSSCNMTKVDALAYFQEKHTVLFEKVLHTSYSTLLASIVRIMLHARHGCWAGA